MLADEILGRDNHQFIQHITDTHGQLGVGILNEFDNSSRNTRRTIGDDNTEFPKNAAASVDPRGSSGDPRRPHTM
jgi:hypothetical protein